MNILDFGSKHFNFAQCRQGKLWNESRLIFALNFLLFQPSTQRKSSLATLQKTLDSILEESEHDSSTHKKSSISSLESSLECTENESEPESEEDFDSDCSIVSEQVSFEDTEAVLARFEAETESFIREKQERMLEHIPGGQNQKERLENLKVQITTLDQIVAVKDQFLAQALKSSMDLKDQMVKIKQEFFVIKSQLDKAEESLKFSLKSAQSQILLKQILFLRGKIAEIEAKNEQIQGKTH